MKKFQSHNATSVQRVTTILTIPESLIITPTHTQTHLHTHTNTHTHTHTHTEKEETKLNVGKTDYYVIEAQTSMVTCTAKFKCVTVSEVMEQMRKGQKCYAIRSQLSL